MKNAKNKKLLIEQLQKTPIIEITCQKVGIGRTTYYRWREQDEDFRKAADEALAAGFELVNDLSEAQLFTMIKEKNFSAIQLWLRHHHVKYGNKIEVTATIKESDKELSPEQKALISEALRLAALPVPEENQQKNEQSIESSKSSGEILGSDTEQPENKA